MLENENVNVRAGKKITQKAMKCREKLDYLYITKTYAKNTA